VENGSDMLGQQSPKVLATSATRTNTTDMKEPTASMERRDSTTESSVSRLALTLGGGGARAAFQVGVLRAIAQRHPDLNFPLISGVSAGAINISYLANFQGNLQQSVDGLIELWRNLKLDNVFRTDGPGLLWRATKIGMRLSVGLPSILKPVHGMVDTQPLREYLCEALGTTDGMMPGIARNIADGKLQGVALTTNSYATSETVTFFAGQEIKEWERPNRRSVRADLSIEHVMASSALPLPPVRIGDHWYGDGGVRLNAPLAPAVQMGADRLIVISNHFIGPSATQAPTTEVPSPATVLSALYNNVFLDQLDQDSRTMKRVNELVRSLPDERRDGLREIKLLVLRPSIDIGALAFDLRDRVPPTLRMLLNRFGGGQRGSDDFLSALLFHPDYVERLIEIGQRDGESQADQIAEFLRA